MLPQLTTRILGNWNNFFPGSDSPRTIRYLNIPGSVEGGTTTFLAFSDREAQPLFAVKIHRDSDAQERALNERNVLNHIESWGGLALNSVPRVIICDRIEGVWLLVESILDGRPVFADMADDGTPEMKVASANMNLIIEWLGNLYACRQVDNDLTRTVLQDGLNMIKEFSDTFEFSTGEKNFIKDIYDGLKNVLNEVFIQHGDFCRHNILTRREQESTKVGVIDWTDSKMAGFPFHDLFFFITTYYLQVRKYSGIVGFIQAFEDTFFNKNPYSSLIKDTVTLFCQKVGIDIKLVEIMFGMFLIERAIFDYRQSLKCSKRGGLPRFKVYLASLEKYDYPQAIKAQIWTHFFKVFVERRKDFIV